MKKQNLDDNNLKKRVAFLKESELFADLDENDLNVLAQNLHPKRYKKKEIIFHQGDDSRSFYLILKGKVRVVRVNESGNETSIRIYSDHDVIGEFSAIDGKPRSATVQALEDCVLLEIVYGKFLQLISEFPKLALGLINVLVKKLRWATSFAETIAQYDTAGRLMHIFLHYKDLLGKEIVAGKMYELNLSMNQSDLASLVGARREWVNRILQDWKRRDLIDYKNGKITIIDLASVEKERNRRMFSNSSEDIEW
jgi:CRP/FNR family transcriptional regulator/CRP/FNR family cyclic AMP-dependent transcriptional regulator